MEAAPFPHPGLSRARDAGAAGWCGPRQSPSDHRALKGHLPPALWARGTSTGTT